MRRASSAVGPAARTARRPIRCRFMPSAGGTRFPLDRDAEDHVYCMFEFPGPGYDDAGTIQARGYYDPEMNYPDPKKGIPVVRRGPEQEDRRHLFVDQRQRLRRLWRDGDGHQGDAAFSSASRRCCCSRTPTPRPRSASRTTRAARRSIRRPAARGLARQGGRRQRPGQPRLHRGDRALGLVHPQQRSRAAALPGRGRPGRRGDRPGLQRRDGELDQRQGRLHSSSRRSGTTSTTTPRRTAAA